MKREKFAEKLRDFTYQPASDIQNSLGNSAISYESLFNTFSDLLFSLINKIIPDQKKAEEIFIDVFVLIRKNLKENRINSDNFFPWIIFLARNCAANFLRNEKSKINFKISSEDYEEKYIIPFISPYLKRREINVKLKEKAQAAINHLTDIQWNILYKSFYECVTDYEIAAELKIPMTTVQLKIEAALNKLSEKLKGYSFYKTDYNVTGFALGSISEDEFLSSKEIIKRDDILLRILAHYQEIISLLPLLLEIKNSPEGIKEKIDKNYLRSEEDRIEKEAIEFLKKINKEENKIIIDSKVNEENSFTLKSIYTEQNQGKIYKENYRNKLARKYFTLFLLLFFVTICTLIYLFF